MFISDQQTKESIIDLHQDRQVKELTAVLCVYNQFISYLNLSEIVFCPFGIHRCILKLVLSVFSHKNNKNQSSLKFKMAAKKRAEKRRSSLSRKTIAKRAIQDGSVGGASSSTSSSNNQPQQAENVAITTTTPQNYTPTTTKLRKVVNKSYEKIINNSYISSKVRNTRMTRSLSKKLSSLYKKKQDTLNATGYKLQEVALLKQSINNAGVCKPPRGKLEILSKPNKRHGLAESMLLRCTLCNHKTPLETSPKVSPSLHLQKKKKSKVYDINICSVLASFANGIGHSGLKQLCADLNIHPPVQKLSFNNITKLISTQRKQRIQRYKRN